MKNFSIRPIGPEDNEGIAAKMDRVLRLHEGVIE